MKKKSKIITKIKCFFKRIILNMTMTEWDPELPEEKKEIDNTSLL